MRFLLVPRKLAGDDIVVAVLCAAVWVVLFVVRHVREQDDHPRRPGWSERSEMLTTDY